MMQTKLMKREETETDKLLSEYRKLDKLYNVHRDIEYEKLVNFSQTKNEPISRWFHYQEGYSLLLVTKILKHLERTGKETLVFDPFSGSGTTLLASKNLGLHSIGFEINPFSAFMIKAKTQNYTKKEIDMIGEFHINAVKPIQNVYEKYELKIIKNLFDKDVLIKIENIKNRISGVKNEKVRIALYAALFSILEEVSNYKKGGNGLKRKMSKKNVDVFGTFRRKCEQIEQDLKNVPDGLPEPTIINDSCFTLDEHNISNVSISIFSPPYANCFDPFEVYKTELWIGEFVKTYDELKAVRRKALTSNLNADVNKKIGTEHRTRILNRILDYLYSKNLWDNRLPKMIDTYFNDMYVLLKKIYTRTQKGGYCVIVVGNSSYGNLPIPTDLILAQLGEMSGFKPNEIIIARKNETSSQQHKTIGEGTEYIRESLVILKK